MNYEKKNIIRCVFLTLVVIVFVVINTYITRRNEENKAKSFSIAEDFSRLCQIESVSVCDGKVDVNGWYIHVGEDCQPIDSCEYTLLMVDVYDESNIFLFDMKYTERQDVNEYFGCHNEYLNSGFVAGSKKKVSTKEKAYEFLLKPNLEEQVAIRTGCYFVDGKKTYIDPRIELPASSCDELNIIFSDGALLTSDDNAGLYIFQYDNKIYWIVDERFFFENGDAKIDYEQWTTQPERLPERRIELGADWDDRDAMFSEYEDIDLEDDVYRVCVRDIPTEFAVTKMFTKYKTSQDQEKKHYFRIQYAKIDVLD